MTEDKFVVDLYIRVSTDRQAKEGDSLEEQESELKKFCEYRGFQIHKVLVERGKSGGNTNRPEYQKLLVDIEAKKINAVVVKKLDRLSRSLLDFEQLMTRLQANEVEFISLRENFDTTTAMGKAMLRVALVFAQLEREQTSERIKDVMEYRASQGCYNGGAVAFGYSVIDKELIPYKKEKEIVELIFAKFLDLKSIWDVAQLLNDGGIPNRRHKPWLDTQIQAILKNPVYTGRIQWKGQNFEGSHLPIISTHKFELVQDIFKQTHGKKRSKISHPLFKKILVCGCCDKPMTLSYAYNRTKTKYFYYRCTSLGHNIGKKSTCTIRQINLDKLEAILLDLLANLSGFPEFKKWQIQVQEHNTEVAQSEFKYLEEIKNIEAVIATLKDKKDSFLESLVSNQFLSGERKRINERMDELETEIKRYQSQLFKTQFEKSQLSEKLIDTTTINEMLVIFKNDLMNTTIPQQQAIIAKSIARLIYHPKCITIFFSNIPFECQFLKD